MEKYSQTKFLDHILTKKSIPQNGIEIKNKIMELLESITDNNDFKITNEIISELSWEVIDGAIIEVEDYLPGLNNDKDNILVEMLCTQQAKINLLNCQSQLTMDDLDYF